MFSSGYTVALALVISLFSQTSAFPATHQNGTLNAPRKIGKRCTGQIQSLTDIPAAEECDTIVIGGFTVPAGETFTLNAPDGASVSLTGELTFGFAEWEGPLMVIGGNDVTFNGNNHLLNGQGQLYWDGLGGNGGVTKPAPLLVLNMGGTFSDIVIFNSPQRAVAVNGNSLTVSGVMVDNGAGTAPNSISNGAPAGANTDGFDVAANDVTITGCVVDNQDDCLAINRGTSITFSNNVCQGIGHGISIASGSISSDATVSGVTISGNTMTGTENGLRIKTDATATGSIVENVVYSNNVGTGITNFGILIDQSYPATLGTPGTGVIIENVSFEGSNSISVASSAHAVEVNCGSTSSCTGTWNWSGLKASGGDGSKVLNAPVTGFSA